MAFAYSKLIRNAALRVSAVVGGTRAAVDAAFATTPLTAVQIGSVEFPITALQDAAIGAVARLVRAYAQIRNHPFRTFNLSQTDTIANLGLIPSVDSNDKPIVGVYGAIRNASTGAIMTEQPKQIIETIVGDSQLKQTYNYFKIIDGRLYCTANAKIDVVTFDEATERGNLAAGDTPLPDALFDAAWAAMAATLFRDDAYVSQAQMLNSYVEQTIAEMRGGAVNFLPAPEHLGTSTPGVS